MPHIQCIQVSQDGEIGYRLQINNWQTECGDFTNFVGSFDCHHFMHIPYADLCVTLTQVHAGFSILLSQCLHHPKYYHNQTIPTEGQVTGFC